MSWKISIAHLHPYSKVIKDLGAMNCILLRIHPPKSHVVHPSPWGGSSIQGVGLGGLCISPLDTKETGTDVKTVMSLVLACLLMFLAGSSGCLHHTCHCMGRVFICQESKVVQVPRDIPTNTTEL